MTRGELLALLRAQPWAVEATLDREGQPQAAVIGVAVTEKLELVFDTLSDSRKAANSRGSPRVALVMGWDDGQTAQIEGIADEPVGDELQQLKHVYLQRIPDGISEPRLLAWPISGSRLSGSATTTSARSHRRWSCSMPKTFSMRKVVRVE